MRTVLSAAAIVASVCSAACGGAREMMGTLGALQEVQRQVASSIPHENVSVNLNNGRFLTVGIVNSSLKSLPPEQKETKAREIAAVAYRAFPSRSELESVGVVFVVNRTYFLFFHYNDATDYRAFAAMELAANSQNPTASDK